MLFALLDYIKKNKCASIEQLSREFHIESDALFPMLDKWVKKGVIDVYQAAGCKQKCSSCSSGKLAFYQISL